MREPRSPAVARKTLICRAQLLTARQLHAVLAVAEYNSFIAAASFLKTSQPALTRTIKRVEDVLGVRLFDRSTRRVAITAAGKEFVAVAERMLNDLRISVGSMREIGAEQRGRIIVSSITSVANGLFPAIVAKYRASRATLKSFCVKACTAPSWRTCAAVPTWALLTWMMFLTSSRRSG
jgi:DNA-binding MarR family transcriptional regulator